jgi:pyridoxamine 5'-phosphate oxidase
MSQIDPIDLFRTWLIDAEQREPSDPTATALATVGSDGRPVVRMVLLRGFDERGFVFYTNTESRKGRDLRHNPYAALCFHWKSTDRQVRVEGPVELVDEREADDYFASRTHGSQIGAWASKQSEPLGSRFELETQVAKYALRFAIGKTPRPPFWAGYRIRPELIEFWEKRPFRLHDRALYTHTAEGWRTEKLYP